ncbi:MAG: reverse transcriptase [Campylobacterota bacterium]|nr:reverse transcriptase [Campylobacterota bacterium]
MFTFENIYIAYKKCRKNKTNTISVLKFEQNLLDNLWQLTDDLQNRRYTIGKSICFLTHSPKLREVFAADFRDRIVHHLLIDAIEPFYERKFISDVYNNRKGKGIHQAKARVQKFMRRELDGYYLQLDIKGFFYHLDKDILYERLCEDLRYMSFGDTKPTMSLPNKKLDDILWLARSIIYHNPTTNYHFQGDIRALKALAPHKTLFKISPSRGLPIGNLTSQFFANVYMNRFDHFVKRELKAQHYLRYVDDFVILEKDEEVLKRYKESIEIYLNIYLSLSLRDDSKIRKNSDGLDFLGYIIRPNYSLVRRRVVSNYKQKKAIYLQKYETQKGKMNFEEIRAFLSVQASFVSHSKHANSFNLLHKVGKIDENNPFDFDRA